MAAFLRCFLPPSIPVLPAQQYFHTAIIALPFKDGATAITSPETDAGCAGRISEAHADICREASSQPVWNLNEGGVTKQGGAMAGRTMRWPSG